MGLSWKVLDSVVVAMKMMMACEFLLERTSLGLDPSDLPFGESSCLYVSINS